MEPHWKETQHERTRIVGEVVLAEVRHMRGRYIRLAEAAIAVCSS
jgi:hypothetical protein